MQHMPDRLEAIAVYWTMRPFNSLSHHPELFCFRVVHFTMFAMTGFARNMSHIVMGTDDMRKAKTTNCSLLDVG